MYANAIGVPWFRQEKGLCLEKKNKKTIKRPVESSHGSVRHVEVADGYFGVKYGDRVFK